ncbi:MAG: type IX secretion system membrane protein PorP/SprF [Bacteroidota bacterium]
MKHFIFTSLLFAVLFTRAQQDAQYNLYQFNPLVINPAYAGSKDVLSVVASVRNQWSGFDGAPRTTCITGHMPIMNKTMGVGGTIVNDKMGPRNNIGIYANYAYILKLSRTLKLSFGLNAGYNRYQFDYSKLTFYANEAPVDLSQSQNHGVLDINGGLYLKGGTYFVGFSATHLTAPSVYDFDANSARFSYRLKSHLFLTAGKSFILNENVVFAPTVLLKSVTNTTMVDVNLNFLLFKKLWLGAFFRSAYGPGFLMQYYVTNQFKVAYSFDSGLKDARKLGASHEIMIGFDLSGSKAKTVNPRFL